MKIYNKFASTIYYTSKQKNEIKNKKTQEAKTNTKIKILSDMWNSLNIKTN